MTNTAADYRRCAEAGLTQKQTADRLGVSDTTVSRMGGIHGISFAPAKMGCKANKASQQIGQKTRAKIVALMAKDRTADEVSTLVGCGIRCAQAQLSRLEQMGLVRRVEVIDRVVIWGRA